MEKDDIVIKFVHSTSRLHPTLTVKINDKKYFIDAFFSQKHDEEYRGEINKKVEDFLKYKADRAMGAVFNALFI